MKQGISVSNASKLITEKLSHFFGVSTEDASNEQIYKAVSMIVRDIMIEKAADFRSKAERQNSKQIYYLCMEFLMGRSLKNNIYNLGLSSVFHEALGKMDVSIDTLYELEPDAGLGNGGLGRLAACYLDGLATDGYSSMGYSILYEAGIFKQKLVDGWQTELPDFWLPGGDVWLVPRDERSVQVKFGGYVEEDWNGPYHTTIQKNCNTVTAVPCDMYVSGKGKGVSRLRLWSAKSSAGTGLDMSLFNQGDFLRAMEENAMAEAISKVLYPADNHPEGKSLRLRQQYFLVSASIQDIVHRHLAKYGTVDNLPEKIAIHINDTHPTLAIPELMRILLDDCGYEWDKAWSIVSKTIAYTNHTVMKEALECWGEDLYRSLLPRIYEITKEIDNRFRAYIWGLTGDADKVERMAIMSNGVVRMANLCVAGSHSVNGVSALHSQILKDTVFHDFYTISPSKFTNVTNGIAFRRWLCQANPELTSLMTELIGDGFITKSDELLRLEQFKSDAQVLKRLEAIKLHNKENFAQIVKKRNGVEIDPNSIFDVQVKRLHEYKRQHLNVLNIISEYQMLKANPNADFTPKTYIFAAKAAPGYFLAKKIIELIDALSKQINNDPDIKGKIKIVYMEDYNVSLAEKLMPAAEISEQISLAGTEASGTGNMKLMLNGALTLGTLDGANVEICNEVGEENMFLFGMTTPEVNDLQKKGYNPREFLGNNQTLLNAVTEIGNGINGKSFREVSESLITSDPYMVLADFEDYRRTQKLVNQTYNDRNKWNQMSLINIAKAGIFSSDRAITEYAQNIWHTVPVVFQEETLKTKKFSAEKQKSKKNVKSKKDEKPTKADKDAKDKKSTATTMGKKVATKGNKAKGTK